MSPAREYFLNGRTIAPNPACLLAHMRARRNARSPPMLLNFARCGVRQRGAQSTPPPGLKLCEPLRAAARRTFNAPASTHCTLLRVA
eukprot:2450681-Pleurochrysis_carterae.AAC.1